MIDVSVNGIACTIPTSPQEVLLKDYIGLSDKYTKPLLGLKAKVHEILSIEKESRTDEQNEELERLSSEITTKLSAGFFSYYADANYKEVIKSGFLETILTVYFCGGYQLEEAPGEHYLKDEYLVDGEKFYLPSSEITIHSEITFGEIIDSKLVIQSAMDNEKPTWHTYLELCLIFLRKHGEQYTMELRKEDGQRTKDFENITMDVVLAVIRFFTELNDASNQFPVFHGSKLPSSKRISKHLDKWGWYNYLKSIANRKVFDLPGYNSLDSARMAKWYDVVLYSSEEKLFNEADALDQKEKQKSIK